MRRLLLALLLAVPTAGPTADAQAQRLVPAGTAIWRDADPRHGGVSGIEVGRGGTAALTVSDRGSFATVSLIRRDGRLVAARTGERRPIRDTAGRPPSAEESPDAEGLALRPDGRIYVSLERPGRVWTWRDTGSEAAWMPRAPGFRRLGSNKALEALAIDARGRLWTAPETAGGPLWVYEGGAWRVAATLPARGRFRVVGADFGPDGALWLLERRFGAGAFTSRIRRLTLEDTRIVRDETLLTTRPGAHGNLEGLSVWRGPDGKTHATAVADDNFLPFLATEIVEWVLE